MGQVMDGIRDLYDAKWIGCWVWWKWIFEGFSIVFGLLHILKEMLTEKEKWVTLQGLF
jgi:hypothetical protein